MASLWHFQTNTVLGICQVAFFLFPHVTQCDLRLLDCVMLHPDPLLCPLCNHHSNDIELKKLAASQKVVLGQVDQVLR